ncbi:hypothetical protein ACFOON_15130 [Novosphingobium piscinae]|uniref:Uncharacterized protein n=1 Tax=Novosphingobium piscinae TaxID=1507448 RepID=A0A7X1FXC4_9SPHN|nr:hypothetical protein [Novosphingobium piscinae]MBC2668766.1 hypothetical protein [Novosphingobium piscinae]
MIPLPWLGGAAALTLIAGFLGGWTARDWKADSDELAARSKAEARADRQREKGQQEGAKFAAFSADNAGQTRTDSNTIRETFREIQVPSDCAAPDALVRLLRDRVEEANSGIATPAAGEPVRPVPQGSTPARSADRP